MIISVCVCLLYVVGMVCVLNKLYSYCKHTLQNTWSSQCIVNAWLAIEASCIKVKLAVSVCMCVCASAVLKYVRVVMIYGKYYQHRGKRRRMMKEKGLRDETETVRTRGRWMRMGDGGGTWEENKGSMEEHTSYGGREGKWGGGSSRWGMKTFAISPMTKINVTFLPDPVIQFVCVRKIWNISAHTHTHSLVCVCAFLCACMRENEQAAANHSGRLSGAAHNPADVASQPKRIDLNTESDSRAGEGGEMKGSMKMREKRRGTEVSGDISWLWEEAGQA